MLEAGDFKLLAFEQALGAAIDEADAWISREDIVRVMEAKLAELRQERLDG